MSRARVGRCGLGGSGLGVVRCSRDNGPGGFMSSASTSVDDAVEVGLSAHRRQTGESIADRSGLSALPAVSDRSTRRLAGHAMEWLCSAVPAVVVGVVAGVGLEMASGLALVWLA